MLVSNVCIHKCTYWKVQTCTNVPLPVRRLPGAATDNGEFPDIYGGHGKLPSMENYSHGGVT